MIPTESARTLEEIDRAFGAGRRAFLIASDPRGGEEKLVRFARALAEQLRGSPEIESVEYGYGEMAAAILRELALPWGPLFATQGDLPGLERKLSREGIDAAVARLAAQMAFPGVNPL